MELEVISSETNELVILIKGKKETILNLLVSKLLEDKSVEFAGYEKEHPLIENYTLTIKTNKGKPVTVLKKTIESLIKEFSSIKLE